MSTIAASAGTRRLSRRALRLLAVAGAALAALCVYVLATAAFDLDLRQPAFQAGKDAQDLSAGWAAVVAAFAALAGWGLLALLERFTERAPRVWAVLAGLVFLLTLGGPFSGHGVSDDNRLALLAMHVAVAAVVIPLLYRSASRDA
ncbi:MAG TPA: DUF6069 family protein [Solirubrobacteraceae bacterium]|jgi:hypothetical protein|nr:DUF6069 family protein [Solirubrobacteraceae bacterium]